MKPLTISVFVLVFAVKTNLLFSQAPLCEHFNEGTFPPTGWTINYTGTNYWLHSQTGCSQWDPGSAEYNSWLAPAGTNEEIITSAFQATSTGDSLIMAMSYALYPSSPPYAQDSLIILASTNGGSSYISSVRLGPTEMNTCPPGQNCNTGAPWFKRVFWLPTGTNKIQFLGVSGFGNNVFIDSICILSHLQGIINYSNIANDYSLLQNYPNPFNPSTIIKYNIPKEGFVKLAVTDALGKEVKLLVNEYKQAGEFTVQFDAENLASGVYFYSIEATNYTATKKMLLLK